MRDYFVSLFGVPASSMSIVAGDKWYMFKRKRNTLQVVKVIDRKLCDYIVVDTGVKITEDITKELNALKGMPARRASTFYLRANCVLTFRRVLKMLGERWEVGIFDFIPSFYMIKRIDYEARKPNDIR